jgi:hypothetical protein
MTFRCPNNGSALFRRNTIVGERTFLPLKGEARRGMGVLWITATPIPILTLPLKGRGLAD